MIRWIEWPVLLLASVVLLAAGCAPITPAAVANDAVGTSSEEQSSTTREDDKIAIRELLAELEEGWVIAEGSAVAETFTEDADFVAGDGRYVKGSSAIAPYFDFVFEEIFPGGHAVTEEVNIRFLADDVAIMHTTGGIIFPGQTEVSSDRLGMQTFVVVKQDGQWLFTAYQNTGILEYLQD